jgi:hypothetical protein
MISLKSQLFSFQQREGQEEREREGQEEKEKKKNEKEKKTNKLKNIQKKIILRAEKVGFPVEKISEIIPETGAGTGTEGEGEKKGDDDEGDDYSDDDYNSDGAEGGGGGRGEGRTHGGTHGDGGHGDGADDEHDEMMMTMTTKEYNFLIKEIKELKEIEKLYEKENQRMVTIILEKENEMKRIKSEFYDQRDSWIQQINRLSNQQYIDNTSSYNNNSKGTTQQHDFLPTQTTQQHDFLPTQQNIFRDEYEQQQQQQQQQSQWQHNHHQDRDVSIYNLQEYIYQLESQCRQRENEITQYEKKMNSLECEKVVLIKNLEIMKKNFLIQNKNNTSSSTQQPHHPQTQSWQQHSQQWSAEMVEEIEGEVEEDVVKNVEEVEVERMKYLQQIHELQSRLKWYAMTQEKLDVITAEKDQLATELREIKARQGQGGGQSVMSSTTQRRNPQDIKRIKYLTPSLSLPSPLPLPCLSLHSPLLISPPSFLHSLSLLLEN